MFTIQELVILMMMIYNYEPAIITIIKMFMTTYSFKNKKELQDAVDLWCSKETHEGAEKEYGNISNWNVSQITDMSFLFDYQRYFNDDISYWDVSNVKCMRSMFSKA